MVNTRLTPCKRTLDRVDVGMYFLYFRPSVHCGVTQNVIIEQIHGIYSDNLEINETVRVLILVLILKCSEL